MPYDIVVTDVPTTILASVRRRTAWRDIGPSIRLAFDAVYAALDAQAIGGRGHNVCIYHAPDADGCSLETGVQIAAPFEPQGELACSHAPSGRAATTVHVGEYHLLGAAHDALAAYGRERGGVGLSWEVYGDWADDPSERRTDVYMLLP